MPTGLPVTRLIRVNVNLAPTAAQALNFGTCLIVGDSNVINVTERIRSYGSLAAVAADFGTSAPEYAAAQLFFSQVPQPSQLYIGRWAQAATSGLNVGGPLTSAQQVMSNWTVVTAGAFKVQIDGSSATLISGLNFSAAANLNAVAAIIQTALRAIATGGFTLATCTWDAVRGEFTIGSGTTGASSAVSALTAPGAGTDISAQLKMTSGTLTQLVAGIAAETALAAVTILDALKTQWYMLAFASTHTVNADYTAVAAYIEAATNPHLFGVTTSEAAALTSNDSTSIGFLLKASGYNRSLAQYSSGSAYAVASIFGRMATVNFNGNATTITLMYKQEPGVTSESLTSAQADALDTNNYNYFAAFNNNTSIIVNGKVASGQFIDTVWDVDWQADAIRTNVYNRLYGTTTKVPQTDAGMHQLATVIEAACAQGVNNGTLGPGTWTSAGFGQLVQGGFLSKGYYVYTPPIASQSDADRAARKSVAFQVALKLAGAVHSADVQVNVNA